MSLFIQLIYNIQLMKIKEALVMKRHESKSFEKLMEKAKQLEKEDFERDGSY